MAEHAFLRRTGVIRGDHEHRVGARLLGLLHHAHGVRGVVGTGAGNDRHVHDFLDGLNQLDLLLHVGGRRFAGGAVDHKTVGTIRHELPRQLLRGFEIYGSVSLHGGDHGRKDTSEGSRIEQMHSTVSLRACHTANGTSLCGRLRLRDMRNSHIVEGLPTMTATTHCRKATNVNTISGTWWPLVAWTSTPNISGPSDAIR